MPSAIESTRTRALLLITILALLAAGLPQAAHAAAPTQAPEIIAPSPGSSSSSNPVFRWSPVDGAVKYRIQVSTSSAFSSLAYNVDTYSLSSTPPADLPLGILYWRVAATDGASGIGPFAESNFEKTIPLAPVPISPADGDTLTYPSEPPVFSWEPIPGAKTYKLEIDDAPDFIGATSYTTNNTSYAPLEPQTVDQSFFWRVQGVTASGINSEWSTTFSYTVEWPTVPIQTSPADGATVEDVVFAWEPVVGAASYQLQVSPNGDWANNKTIDVIVEATRYSHQLPSPSQQIFNNGSYFWRVRAQDNKGAPANFGGWSAVRQFTRGWPDKPTLLTPANGDLNVTTPSFSWTPVDHASHYELQLSSDPNFSPGTVSSCYTHHTEFTPYRLDSGSAVVLGSCSSIVNSFAVGSLYYWRVRGIDSPGNFNGIWSDPASFIYKTQTPTMLTPADGSTVETPTLTWTSSPSISQYNVTIKDAGGSTVLTTTTHATSYTPTQELDQADGPFKWFVRTVDMEGRMGLSPSEANQFTFELTDPSAPGSSPDPITPADGEANTDMPSMTWQPVTGADHYKVLYGVVGSGVENLLSGTTELPYAGFTYAGEPLARGNYFWYVNAYDTDGAYLGSGPQRTFQVADLPTVTYTSPQNCVPDAPCDAIADTPTLEWEGMPDANHYLVYLSNDANFTNVIKTYKTQYTQLTPRESLLDNQAGQAYYWFVRPCTSSSRCGPFDNDVFPTANAFRKRSAPINLTSPADGATVPNQITLSWEDYLTTNQALTQPVTQEAKSYRVQVSTVADFATTLDEAIVDQTTYTAAMKTYPEGPLYWRVQAIDGSGNDLTFSSARTLVKQSPQISLTSPANGASVSGIPYFSWQPQGYAAKYEIEIYKNGDLLWSPTNKVLSDNKAKMAAWAPTTSLAPGTYAWRVRRLDTDGSSGRPGPWSAGRTFSLAPGAPALVSPVDGTDMERNEILLQWGVVDGAPAYRVEVSTSPTFGTTVESQKTVMTSWAPTRKYTDGTYYWQVRVLDAADNAGPGSQVRSFSITTPAPDTTITDGPSGTVESTTAEFEFQSTAGGATFQCSMDGATFSTCTSPKTYSSLAQGSHTFEVRSISEGITDPTPASRTFTVATPPPDTSITDGPSGTVESTTAVFEFTSTAAGATFQCSMDGATFSTCTSPKTYSSLAQGPHTFEVRSISQGITDPTPASRTFTIATPPPDTSLTTGPSGTVKPTSATFEFTSTAAGATFECAIDGGSFSSCSSPKTYTNLAQGSHTFEVRSISSGVTDPSPAQRTWTVSSIDITKIVYKARTLNGEYVQLRNAASTSVSLQGWFLKDASGIRYTFRTYSLAAGASVKIHTGRGSNNSTNLYWGRRTQVWANIKDTAKLYRSGGGLADQCSYNNRRRSSKTC